MNIISEADDLIDYSSAPPRKEAGDEKHYAARDRTGFFGEQGAGCLFMAKSTGRVLIVFRSIEVDQEFTWGNCGGAYDSDKERPVEAARREAYQETGYKGSSKIIPLFVFRKDDFRYHNYLAVVDDEFSPNTGWEATQHVWRDIGDWPNPLHFGLEALFGDEEAMATITHYSDMFKNNSVEEGLNLPAGVDIAKAIGDAKDAEKSLAADAEAEKAAAEKPEDKPEDTPVKKSLSTIGSTGSQ